jgi:hypothetical protein
MNTADTLNQLAAAAQAATDARDRGEKNLQRLNAELERERATVAKSEATREEAIEASIADPDVTIPNVDRHALELAERKAAAATRAVQAAQDAERQAMQRLPGACAAFESAKALDLMEKLYAELAKSKVLAELISLQSQQHANEALFAAGLRISRSPSDRKLTLSFDGPTKIPSAVSVCASALAKYPAARRVYEGAESAEQSAAERARKVKLAEIDQREQSELARHEVNLASSVHGKHPQSPAVLAAKATYLARTSAVKASHAVERARI